MDFSTSGLNSSSDTPSITRSCSTPGWRCTATIVPRLEAQAKPQTRSPVGKGWAGRAAEPKPEGVEPEEVEVHGEPTV
jgi:hypothetical protein